ncbi:hypothetical protein [Moorena producens]|uniref:hypothetical protein n=1 Tax=Moorena producens TaxID=1155739 RepID=UPI003C77B14B
MYFDTYFDEFIRSDAARSWGGSADLWGFPPSATGVVFPTRAWDQDNKITYSPLCKKPTLVSISPSPHLPDGVTNSLKSFTG